MGFIHFHYTFYEALGYSYSIWYLYRLSLGFPFAQKRSSFPFLVQSSSQCRVDELPMQVATLTDGQGLYTCTTEETVLTVHP